MLTRELAIAEYDFARGQLIPDRLTSKSHVRYLGYAEKMLEVYRQGRGLTRRALHRAVADIFAEADDCPQKRIDAFCKLLDDASDTSAIAAAKPPNCAARFFGWLLRIIRWFARQPASPRTVRLARN